MRRLLQRMRTMKDLLEAAEQEALAVGLDEPDAEHLLLAALEAPDGTATAAFRSVGIEGQAIRHAIDDVHRAALAALGVDGAAPIDEPGALPPTNRLYQATDNAQVLFRRAGELARSRPGGTLTSADVVVAACDLEAGTIPQALTNLEVDVTELRAAATTAAAHAPEGRQRRT